MSTLDPSTSFSPLEPDDPIQALALAIADSADALKARAIRIIDVRGLVSYADYIIVCHGTSHTHSSAIANAIRDDIREAGVRPRHVEGTSDSEWVLLDFFDVVVHVFVESARKNYAIESLFADAPRLPFESEEPDEAVSNDAEPMVQDSNQG